MTQTTIEKQFTTISSINSSPYIVLFWLVSEMSSTPHIIINSTTSAAAYVSVRISWGVEISDIRRQRIIWQTAWYYISPHITCKRITYKYSSCNYITIINVNGIYMNISPVNTRRVYVLASHMSNLSVMYLICNISDVNSLCSRMLVRQWYFILKSAIIFNLKFSITYMYLHVFVIWKAIL